MTDRVTIYCMNNTWQQIIGHNWAVQLLANAIAHQRIGHAYLITGPEQIGKTTLARTFAQALNCEADAPANRPCGTCRACTLIANDKHPDVRLMQPEVSGRGKLTLKIEQIRQLQQDLSLATYEGRYKVAILRRFDAATEGAANAFLKTLEEPPARVILLLTALEADTLLPTIISRCRTIALRPLSTDLIMQSLTTRWHVPTEDAHLLAHLADGRLGWAVQAATNPELLHTRRQQLDLLAEVVAGNRITRFALADKLAKKPEILPDVLRTWLSWWRDLTLLAYGMAQNGRIPTITNIDQQDNLLSLARLWPRTAIHTSLKQTEQAIWQLARNANTRLVIENLLLTYPQKESV
ncbi:MAG: DNA polymerase III subunit delta' [Chloroflexi bacterium]|nr:MAG: DNA polymerase III subunit delta' [Chloroflexota bacterium]